MPQEEKNQQGWLFVPPSKNYFSEIADTGQAPVQERQEMHTASSHSDFPFSSRESADTGQTPTHAPHPIHVSLSTVTGIVNPR